MNAAVVSAAVTNVERARKAWGANAPGYVIALAEACDRLGSQGKAAAALSYGEATVSQVLSKKYKGDLKKVQMAVQGAFMNGTVLCPVLGKINSEKCIGIQREEYRAVGHFQTRLYKACRNGCPNFIASGAKNDQER